MRVRETDCEDGNRVGLTEVRPQCVVGVSLCSQLSSCK